MKKSLFWIVLLASLFINNDLLAQCSFSDCSGSPVFNLSTPVLNNGEITFDNLEVGNFFCSGSAAVTSGLSIFIFELLPDGSRVSTCGTFSDGYLGYVPLSFGSGLGCGNSLPLFTPAAPFVIGSSQGFQACDGAVYEIEAYLYLDPNGTVASSSTPYSSILALNSDQREVQSFGPLHYSVSGNFPSTGFGGPYLVNEIGNWNSVQMGGATGQNFTLNCDEDIELYIRATSNLNQCSPNDPSSGLTSELTNTLNYSVNGGAAVDLIAEANLPDSGGVLSGLNVQIGACYTGIYTDQNPTLIAVSDINPVDGDVVVITVSTEDSFTGQMESSTISVTYTGSACGALISGCTDMNACNFDASATVDDGSCIFQGDTCDDGDATTENDVYTMNCICEGTPIPDIEGCTDALACNFNPDATLDDGTCSYPDCEGNCDGLDSGPAQPGTVCDDGNSSTVGDSWTTDCDCVGMAPYAGCMDMAACNFNPAAVVDDGSCISVDCEGNCDGYYSGPAQPGTACDDGDPTTEYDVYQADCTCLGSLGLPGCTDPNACNFNVDALVDDGSCLVNDCLGDCGGSAISGTACDDGDPYTENDTWTVDCYCFGQDIEFGCTDPDACNFDPNAGIDNGMCTLPDCEGNCDGYYSGPAQPGTACDDGDPDTIDDEWDAVCTCTGAPIIAGCTDMVACNFDPNANMDDASCLIIGEMCDDGNAETDFDSINENCECEGVYSSIPAIDNGITFHPNPVEDILTIVNASNTAIIEYLLIDINGKVLTRQIIESNWNNSIDMSSCDSGCYFVQLLTKEESYIAKIIRK